MFLIKSKKKCKMDKTVKIDDQKCSKGNACGISILGYILCTFKGVTLPFYTFKFSSYSIIAMKITKNNLIHVNWEFYTARRDS